MIPRSALVLIVALLLQDGVNSPPAVLGLDPFYQKHLDAAGLPIVSSEKYPTRPSGRPMRSSSE